MTTRRKRMSASTHKHHATRDFSDAGTGRSFKAGEIVDADEGVLANYIAAGLASDKAPEAAKPAA